MGFEFNANYRMSGDLALECLKAWSEKIECFKLKQNVVAYQTHQITIKHIQVTHSYEIKQIDVQNEESIMLECRTWTIKTKLADANQKLFILDASLNKYFNNGKEILNKRISSFSIRSVNKKILLINKIKS